jgi:hypothetical protein
MERLLYRLSRIPAGERFILTGAVLCSIWEGEIPRPTRDVDFLPRLEVLRTFPKWV